MNDESCEFHAGEEGEFCRECVTCELVQKLRAANERCLKLQARLLAESPPRQVADAVSELLAVLCGDGGHCELKHGTAGAAAMALSEARRLMDIVARVPVAQPGDGWIPFTPDVSESLEDGDVAWVVWKGTVQEQPWAWYEGAWYTPGHVDATSPPHVESHVTRIMRLSVPPPPSAPKQGAE